MVKNKKEELERLGSKLDTPPSSKDSLLELLEQVATSLSEVDQLPPANILESMQPLLKAFVKPELLENQDSDIKLLVASCICEIMRITAPEAPYSDDVLKDIFQLIVGTFSGLSDTGSSSFARRVIILETLAKYRSCVVMLDLECDELVNGMFSTFFSVASDDHAESVLSSMLTIMVVLLEESEEVRKDLLLVLFSVLSRDKTGISESARKLSIDVIKQCAGTLEPGIKQFLMASISGDSHSVDGPIDYRDVIYNIYRCAPQILTGVVPDIMKELLADQLNTRLKAVRLVGGFFSLPGCAIPEAFQSIFSEFLKRLADRAVEVRMSVLEHVKSCLLSDPLRREASSIISALCDRLLENDENVRKQVVAVIADMACHSPSSVPVETVKLIADRLQDKSVFVKKYTMERLADIYRSCCETLTLTDNSVKLKEYDWIPGKILRCLYDKDFRLDTIEYILCGSLFPTEFSVKDQVKSWVRVLSVIDKVEVKALEKLLEQKQRLQVEMQRYISLRQMNQYGDVPEIQKKILLCFRIMSRSFAEPSKAEENFQLLDQFKDDNIWKILTNLVDYTTSFHQACTLRDELLRILGENQQLDEFLSALSLTCSYILFNKDHVKEILVEVATLKSTGNIEYISSFMNALVILARFSPVLLKGSEEELVNFLKDDNEVIKEGVLHVLAMAGGIIRDQLTDSSSSVDLLLERPCLEGNRRQAKYAVHALAAITKDDGLKSLSVLYKRLVDMLEEKMHLPAVLQSLGCIAQTAMPVFETRESKIKEFIKSILSSSNKMDENMKLSWDDRSELSLLKTYGIKTLVKSYLPVKDAHLRPDIDGLIEMLRNILTFGEISKDTETSLVDKAHLKLASAKAILRLSRLWDHKIPVDVFYLTLKTVEIGFPQAKKLFLSKVHQYIKDRLLDPKYACAFIFSLQQSNHPDFDEEKQNFVNIIQMLQQAQEKQHSVQSDATSLEYPEYILPHLLHAIAHHSCPDIDDCKDVKAYEPVYRKLHFVLSLLVHKDEDVKSDTTSNKDNIATVVSIFQNIKSSEDIVDGTKSKNSHALCDIGLSIMKHLTKTHNELQGLPKSVSLPVALYRPYEQKEGDDSPVSKGQTWLADESTLSHFESLKLEADGMATSEILGSEVIETNVKEGNEVPLGKMIKHLKSHGNKEKRVKKSKLESTEVKKSENDIDILKMVRDINLDNLGMSTKNESSNGHEQFPSKKTKVDSEDPKNKRKNAGEALAVSIPKRRRSLSVRSAAKASIWDKPQIGAESEEEVPLQRKIVEKTKSARKGKDSDHGSDFDTDEEREDLDSDIKGHNILKKKEKTRPTSKLKSSSTSTKKRKRRSVAGLAKCTMQDNRSHDEDLVGRKIKVWWPMDKQFYEGTVKSYDPLKQKHVVSYDDGEVEVLRMEKERWEFIDNGNKTTKQSKSTKVSMSKRSAEQKGKGSASSNKGKRTKKSEVDSSRRKPQKRRQKGTSKSKKSEADEEKSSDLSDCELDTQTEAMNVNSGKTKQHSERMSESSTDSEAENKLKLGSKNRQLKEKKNLVRQARKSGDDKEMDSDEDMKSAPQDAEESDEEKRVDESEGASGEEFSEEENSDSEEEKKADKVHDSRRRKKTTHVKSSDPSNVTDSEMSDDEPLVKWKSHVGKSSTKRAR